MRDVARRTVLSVGAAAGGLVVLGLDVVGADVADAATASKLPLRSDYERALGKYFSATHGRFSYRLRLERIHDISHATVAQGEHSFNLIFLPTGPERVPDRIYLLRSTHVPAHSLFLSGVGRDRALQALVNRTR